MKSRFYQVVLLVTAILLVLGQSCSENSPAEPVADISNSDSGYIQFKAVSASIDVATGTVTFKDVPEIGIINSETQLIGLDGSPLELIDFYPDDGVLIRGKRLSENRLIISLMMEVVEI